LLLSAAIRDWRGSGGISAKCTGVDGKLEPVEDRADPRHRDEWDPKLEHLDFADDMALFADSLENAQRGLDDFTRAMGAVGLQMNTKRTKLLVTDHTAPGRHPFGTDLPTLRLNGVEIERVREFVCLGSVISANGSSLPDIERRLALADKTLYRMRKIMWNRALPRWIRMKVLKGFVRPVCSYGCETRALGDSDRNKLRVWWMKELRRIYGTWPTQRVKNELIREALGTSGLPEAADHRRRRRYLAHIYRYPEERRVKLSLGAKWSATTIPISRISTCRHWAAFTTRITISRIGTGGIYEYKETSPN